MAFTVFRTFRKTGTMSTTTDNTLIADLQRLGNSDVTQLRTIMQGLCAQTVAPEVAQWAEQTLDAELTRRHTLHEYTYSSLFVENWSDGDLVCNFAFMLTVTRTASMLLTPTAQDWCWSLTNLLANAAGERLLGVE